MAEEKTDKTEEREEEVEVKISKKEKKTDKTKTDNKIKKWLMIVPGCVAVFFIVIILYLKLDTKAAAEFTDNILRPVIGDSRVLYLEKIFFNTTDLVQRVASEAEPVVAPQFTEPDQGNIAGGNLDLTPLPVNNSFKPLPGEGVWRDFPLALFPGQEVMAYTYLRTDPSRDFSITTLVQMDMSHLRMGSVAGIKQPGGPIGKPGPGKVPADIVTSGNLVAAFDGGFQYKDGQYGMIVGDTTYLPLKNGLGTLIGYSDGTLKIVDYEGQDLGSDIDFVRQNCPILISDGQITINDERSRQIWGRLAKGTSDIYTWRSGLGLTKSGNLIFAVGNNLTPSTLAAALQAAGAVNAIQLDINPVWVRFNIFDSIGNGKYNSTTLTKQLQDGSRDYLNGYAKDFFYLYKK